MTSKQRHIVLQRGKLLDQIEKRHRARIARVIDKEAERAALAALRNGRAEVEVKPILDAVVQLMTDGYIRRYDLDRRTRRGIELSFASDTRKAASRSGLVPSHLAVRIARAVDSRVKDSTDFITQRINAYVADVTARQLPTRQATRELRRALNDGGFTLRNASYSETLTRTHSMLATSAAQWELNQNDPLGIITGYLYSAILDGRETEFCHDNDGKIFAVNDPILQTIWTPNHWNCRSQMVEWTDPIESSADANLADVHPDFAFNPGALLQT